MEEVVFSSGTSSFTIYRLGGIAGLQDNINAHVGGNFQLNVGALEALEAGLGDGDPVNSRFEVGRQRIRRHSSVIGAARYAALYIRDLDGCAHDTASLGSRHIAEDSTYGRLREKRTREYENSQCDNQRTSGFAPKRAHTRAPP